MPSSYTTSLRLTLPATGELSGQWGNTVNTGITELLDSAVAGTASISTWGGAGVAYTLSSTSGAADEARKMFIVASGSPGEAKNVICPAVSKFYVFRNDTTGGFALTLKTPSGTGISVPAGQYKFLYCDGTNVVEMFNSAGALSLSGNLTLSGGTANGVAYLNGSKVLTTGSALTFDGTNLAVGSATAFGNKLYVAGNINSSGQIRADIPTAGTSLIVTGTGSNFQVSHATSGFATLLNSGGGLIFSPDNSEQMRLTSTGLGIGTSSPAAKLHTLSAIGGTQAIIACSSGSSYLQVKTNNSAAVDAAIHFNDSAYDAYIGMMNGSSGGVRGALHCYTGGAIRTTLDSSGNLGLGVTPGTWATAAKAIEFAYPTYGMDGNGAAFMSFNARNSTGSTWVYKTTDEAGKFTATTGGGFTWETAPSGTAGNTISFTQAMTLDASGNLTVTGNIFSLGATASSWASGSRAIEFGPSANGFLFNDSNNVNFGANAYYNAGWKYQTSSVASSRYLQTSGSHAWYTAPSGTAGNAITFTQAMTLDASGNWLVGTTATTGGRATISAVANYGDLATGYSLVLANSAGTGTSSNPQNIGVIQFGNPTLTNSDEGRISVVQESPSGSTASSMRFFTNGGGGNAQTLERARITSVGEFLVGTANASVGTAVGCRIVDSGGRLEVAKAATTNSDVGLSQYSTGAAAYRFYVGYGGTVYATSTTITAISDQRLKENIRDLDAGLSEIMALKPRKFDWKPGKGKDKKNDRGWIAQEFEQVFPDMVDTWQDPAPEGEEPYKAVNADLIPVLVKALQEQQALITALTARVAALEAQP